MVVRRHFGRHFYSQLSHFLGPRLTPVTSHQSLGTSHGFPCV